MRSPKTNPRRVVHIVEAFTGGVAQHVLDLMSGLPQWDQHAIISPGRDGRAPAQTLQWKRARLQVHIVPMRREIAPPDDFLALLLLVRKLRSLRPAIVHCHSAKAGILGRLAATLAGVPVRIYTPHALPFHEGMSPPERWLYWSIEQTAGWLTTRLVAVSSSEAEAVRHAGLVDGARLRVISNAVPRREENEDRVRWRRALDLPEDRPVVLCVAHLRPQKAPLDWLKMTTAVSRERPDALFLWVGDGMMEPQFLAAAKHLGPNRFRYLGYMDSPRPAYLAADVFTLASLWEGCPYTLLEAMSWGLPCAATAVTGSIDLIRDGETGLLAPPGQPKALARCVLELLNDPWRAGALGWRGREAVRREHTMERFLALHDALYSEALEGV